MDNQHKFNFNKKDNDTPIIIHTAASIFQLPLNPTEAACVTTNGIIKPDGNAVMGKGIAKEADDLYHVSAKLGTYIKLYGNRCFDLGLYPAIDPVYDRADPGRMFHLISFPTKYNWKNNSDIGLIKESCINFLRICDARGILKCYLPAIGCGCGGLDFQRQVLPVVSEILDSRFLFCIR